MLSMEIGSSCKYYYYLQDKFYQDKSTSIVIDKDKYYWHKKYKLIWMYKIDIQNCIDHMC